MTRLALIASIEAKTGREDEVATLLADALATAASEPGTQGWVAFRSGPSTFGMFQTFDDQAGRDACIEGAMAALLERAGELLAWPPRIDRADVIADRRAGGPRG